MSFREDQAARLNVALEKADVALRSKIEELSFVSRVGEVISRHTSSRELSAELVEIVAETILCNYAVLYRRAPDGQYALHAASQVFGDGNFPNSFDLSLLREDLTSRAQSFGIHDLSNLQTTEEWPFPIELRSWLFVPLKVCETAGAILILADAEASAISPQMQRTLMMVTPQISSALSNIELYEDLRASETKYRTFVEGMQDAVYICTPDLRIVESNPAAQALSALASPHRCLKDLFTSEEAAREFEKAIRISGRVQDFEADFFASAGKPVVGSVSAVADPQRVSVIIRDITVQKQLSKQLVRTQKMESIGTLASGIAHDFNNVLGIILPTAEMLQLQDAPDKRERRLEAIVDASKRATKLTKQLLKMARDEPPSVQPLVLNDVVRSTQQLLEETLERTVHLDLELTGDLPHIKADENELAQMLINLAVNARDAMHGDGSITFRTQVEDHGVLLTVSDTGPGIAADVVDKIFDPFFTTKDRGDGTGLGLSMVYATVQRHGGTIDVRTEIGKGTEFRLWFPTVIDQAETEPQDESESAGGRETILVVDDEPDMLDLVEASLSALGYRVLMASNGEDALSRMTSAVDLVILDMIMPVMDGLAALEIIRQKHPHAKVIVATGYAAPDRLEAAEELGIDGVLAKPFPLAQLTETVREVLDGVAA